VTKLETFELRATQPQVTSFTRTVDFGQTVGNLEFEVLGAGQLARAYESRPGEYTLTFVFPSPLPIDEPTYVRWLVHVPNDRDPYGHSTWGSASSPPDHLRISMRFEDRLLQVALVNGHQLVQRDVAHESLFAESDILYGDKFGYCEARFAALQAKLLYGAVWRYVE
jgi:hypothetical protein